MPLEWLKQDIEEPKYEAVLSHSGVNASTNVDDRSINFLFNSICTMRQTIPTLQVLKIDLYIDSVLGITKDTINSSLHEMIINKMSDSKSSMYLLSFLNYKISVAGNQIGVTTENGQFLRDTLIAIIKCKNLRVRKG